MNRAGGSRMLVLKHLSNVDTVRERRRQGNSVWDFCGDFCDPLVDA